MIRRLRVASVAGIAPADRGSLFGDTRRKAACLGFVIADRREEPEDSPRRLGSARIVASLRGGADGIVASRSGWDSDLEAFSRFPSDGSLAPLAYQPST